MICKKLGGVVKTWSVTSSIPRTWCMFVTSTHLIFVYLYHSFKKNLQKFHPLILDTSRFVAYCAHNETKECNVDQFMLINIILVKFFKNLYK